MADVKSRQETQQVKKAKFRVVEVEKDAAIVLFDGWRKRVYFDGKKDIREGQIIEVEYTGDLKDVHSVQFLKLK